MFVRLWLVHTIPKQTVKLFAIKSKRGGTRIWENMESGETPSKCFYENIAQNPRPQFRELASY